MAACKQFCARGPFSSHIGAARIAQKCVCQSVCKVARRAGIVYKQNGVMQGFLFYALLKIILNVRLPSDFLKIQNRPPHDLIITDTLYRKKAHLSIEGRLKNFGTQEKKKEEKFLILLLTFFLSLLKKQRTE